jgi:hypothetical protein
MANKRNIVMWAKTYYTNNSITNDVRYYTDNGDFEASWVLVATWVNAEVVDTDVSYFMVYILYWLMFVNKANNSLSFTSDKGIGSYDT